MHMQFKARNSILFAVLIIALLLLLGFDFVTGSTYLSLRDLFLYIFNQSKIDSDLLVLIRDFRITRVLTAVLAGSALALAGLLMQTIFRNPLAGPYVLGVSSGAGFGVAIAVMGASAFGINAFGAGAGLPVLISAALGSAGIMLIIIIASLKMRDNVTVLILGMLMGAVVSALISVIEYTADSLSLKAYVIWGMGSLSALSFNNMLLLAAVLIPVIGLTFFISKSLNLFLLGEDYAKISGVKTKSLRLIVFVLTCLLAGAVTAFCGPLGFVGIAVPHVARWIFKTNNHFIIIPATIICGAVFMLIADILSIRLAASGILPLNAITAITGIPVIIYIIVKNQKSYF
ncbi:MAG: iron ABC transporter permease [Bacteroidales bacterium]|nr:iron ABC transporter permease [Bacteroidales bacterium]